MLDLKSCQIKHRIELFTISDISVVRVNKEIVYVSLPSDPAVILFSMCSPCVPVYFQYVATEALIVSSATTYTQTYVIVLVCHMQRLKPHVSDRLCQTIDYVTMTCLSAATQETMPVPHLPELGNTF